MPVRKKEYMMLIHEVHVFDLRIKTNVCDPRTFWRYLGSNERVIRSSNTRISCMH